jgi:hypothetical protein
MKNNKKKMTKIDFVKIFIYTAERNSGSSISLYKLSEKSNACNKIVLQ